MAIYNSEQTKRMRELHGVRLAPFWRRGAAFLLDISFMTALFAILAVLLEPVLLKLGWIHSSEDIVFALNLNWYSIVWVVVYFGLATYIGRGRTPGKALLRIRVLSLVHTKLSLWHSLERSLGYGASMLEFGFGFAQYFINPNKRTVHDRIAETIVILDHGGKRKKPRKKRFSEAIVLFYFAIFLPLRAGEQPVQNVIADAARPLPLSAVRLTGGPLL